MTHLPQSVVTPVALVPFAAAVVVIATAVLRSGARPRHAGAELAAGLGLGLDLLLAAGLIRLAGKPSLRVLGLVAVVIAVRKISGAGVKAAVRAVGGIAPGRLRA